MIDVNFTLLIQLVNFLILLVVLNALLFKPVLRVLDEREKLVKESAELKERLGALADESNQEYEARILAAKQEAMGIRAEKRSQALAGFRGIIAGAREEGAVELDKARRKIGEQAERSRQELSAEAEKLASNIADKLVGRSLEGRAS